MPALLERHLAGSEVLNLGVHGFGLGQVVRRLERDALPLAPDHVVLLIFLPQDVVRASSTFFVHAKPSFRLDDGRLEVASVPVARDATLPWIVRRSFAAAWLRSRAPEAPAPETAGDHARLMRALLARARDACERADAALTVVPIVAPGNLPLYFDDPEHRISRQFHTSRDRTRMLPIAGGDAAPGQVEPSGGRKRSREEAARPRGDDMCLRPASWILVTPLLTGAACATWPPAPVKRVVATRAASVDVRASLPPRPPAPPAPDSIAALEEVCWSFVLDEHLGPNQGPPVSLHARFDNPEKLAGSDSVYVEAPDVGAAVARATAAVRGRLGFANPPRTRAAEDRAYRDLKARCWAIRTDYHRGRAGARPYSVLVRYDRPGVLVSKNLTAEGASFDDAAAAAIEAIRDDAAE